MKIAIYGFMGAGKTVLGNMLAKRFNHTFIDLDKAIENKTQKDIFEIFHQQGEIYFRNLEHNILKEIIKKNEQNIILSLGGGTIIRPSNIKLLKLKNFKQIYLDVNIDELINRLKKDKNKRPLLKNIQENEFNNYVKALFNTRKSVYENNADLHIKIYKENIEQTLEKIFLYLNLN